MSMEDIACKLIDMNPAPIPRYILLKEFLGGEDTAEAYQAAAGHPHVEKLVKMQTPDGCWPSFHGETEAKVRTLISYSLDESHPSLGSAAEFMRKVLRGEDAWHQRAEKQDNPRWWFEMFMPLVTAAMLSLIAPNDPLVKAQQEIWLPFAQQAFKKGFYDHDAEAAAHREFFGFKTKVTARIYCYYSALLLTAADIIPGELDALMFEHYMSKADGMYYIYNKPASVPVPMDNVHDAYHWLRLLMILSRFKAWEERKDKYIDWLMSQKNARGLWDFIKRPYGSVFPFSDSWRMENDRIIDSSIFVMRLLKG